MRWRRGGARTADAAADAATRSASLPARHALALGLLHGPAELLPVSSSAHTTLVPWLLGWPYPELDGELRKAFEVALHAGTAAALLIALRGEVAEAVRGFDRRRAPLIVLARSCRRRSSGYSFERPIERAPGHAARRSPSACCSASARWCSPTAAARPAAAARTRRAVDALALGLAQACALIPGVSRNGDDPGRARACAASPARTRTRCRATSRCRSSSARRALKGARLARRGVPPGLAPGLRRRRRGRLRVHPGARRGSSGGRARPARWCPTPRTAPRSPRYVLRTACAESGADERRLRRRRRRHQQGRPRRRRARRRAAHDRARPAVALRVLPRALRERPARRTEPRHRVSHRRRRLEARASPSRPIASTPSASTASR